ncbi:hypothetical protein LUZ60_006844 [Juncus effusus]|nr:hypothetical protein LUZ60_006844 [Juncus effusus]
MAATVTMSSCISTTINPKYFPSSTTPFVRFSSSLLHSVSPLKYQQRQITSINPKNRNSCKLLAAVSQEEAPATAVEETNEVEEGKIEEESAVVEGGEGESVSEESPQVEAPNTKLYFGNLPYNCDSSQLAGIVQEYGTPEMVEVLYDRETGRSRGFAFVTMSSVEDCEAVIKNLDGSQYSGRIMRVNFSDKPRPRDAPIPTETEHKLFVGNLSWAATSEDLEKPFQEYGNVLSARVLVDGDTGRSRGYGFVCYSTKEEMDEALENLDGAELNGRPMRVSVAQSRRAN